MEAICKPDYLARLKAKADAEAVLKLRKQKLERTQQQQQLAEKRGWKIKANEHIEEEETSTVITVPKVRFYDIYGVWFHGRIVDELQDISRERFGTAIGEDNHVYISREPNKIGCGVHEIQVYGMTCRFYKWRAQGFHRGLVVLADDEAGKGYARIRKASRTWSWVLRGNQ